MGEGWLPAEGIRFSELSNIRIGLKSELNCFEKQISQNNCTVPKNGYGFLRQKSELSITMAMNNERLLKEFGKNLQKLREAKGMSTRKFAAAADISHSSLGRLESGQSNPTLTTLVKLADALGVDLRALDPRR